MRDPERVAAPLARSARPGVVGQAAAEWGDWLATGAQRGWPRERLAANAGRSGRHACRPRGRLVPSRRGGDGTAALAGAGALALLGGRARRGGPDIAGLLRNAGALRGGGRPRGAYRGTGRRVGAGAPR